MTSSYVGSPDVKATLAAIVQSTDDAIIGESLAGTILSWNPGAERLFGWGSDEAIGRAINLILPEGRSGEQQDLRDAVTRGESIHGFETVRARKDGSSIDVSITVSPIRDDTGKIVGMSKIARDVTEQRQMAARERELQVQTARLKDQFLATLSHELRTPLNAIVGWVDLLLSGPVTDDQRAKAVSAIQRNAQTQLRLIDDLLDASLTLSGRLRLETVDVDLVAAAQRATDVMRPAAEARSIELRHRWPDETIRVAADPDRLQQVIVNLLSNAIKFTDPGGRVTLTIDSIDGQARLRVADTGRGITREFLPHVFDHFLQQDGSRTRRHGGLGLGLSIVRHIVELHGGSVTAESPGEGRGATFTILLPRLMASA